MDDLTKKYHSMFVAAAFFNWTAAIALLKPSILFGALGITPVPNQDFVLHLCSLLIAFFGSMYYSASKDLVNNANMVYAGLWAKAVVVAVAVLDVMLGYISWQILLIVSGDAIFSILFYKALQDLNTVKQK